MMLVRSNSAARLQENQWVWSPLTDRECHYNSICNEVMGCAIGCFCIMSNRKMNCSYNMLRKPTPILKNWSKHDINVVITYDKND